MERFKEAYNKKCKNILSYKIILAKIMKECMEEYKDYDMHTIMNCIEYENPSNKIIGITNDLDDIKYDVFYYATNPMTKHKIGALINIEAQKTSRLKYKIHNRALVYAGYEIAYQYNRIFKNQEYDLLQKVVSIWICFDAPTKEEENSITYFSLFKDVKVGYNIVRKEEYDKLLIVIIYLGENSYQNEFISFLEVLFTNQLTVNDKKRILENKYQIPVDDRMKGELEGMCNLADRIEEKAIEKGQMKAVVNIIKKLNVSFDEAIRILEVPEYLIASCREYVNKMLSV